MIVSVLSSVVDVSTLYEVMESMIWRVAIVYAVFVFPYVIVSANSALVPVSVSVSGGLFLVARRSIYVVWSLLDFSVDCCCDGSAVT